MPDRFLTEPISRIDPALPFATRLEDIDPNEVEILMALRPPAGLFPKLPSLKLIFAPVAGVDGILKVPDRPKHVPIVRSVEPTQAQNMGQYVALMVLRQIRELPEFEQLHRSATWTRRPPIPQVTAGVLGLGPIGSRVAAMLSSLGIPTLGWSRSRKSIPGVETYAGNAELPAFLARCNALVCLLPLTADTRGMLDRAVLSQLPRGATLINVSRGEQVVTADLLALIDSGHLGGAVLDAFEIEPLPQDSPLWRHPKILVTPHIAAPMDFDHVARQFLEARRRLLAGEPLLNLAQTPD